MRLLRLDDLMTSYTNTGSPENGSAWGDGLTEKAVWHVVREYARKAGIERLAPHDFGGHARGFAMLRAANWNRFSFCSGTFRSKRPNDLGCKQRIRGAVNDRIDIEPQS